MSLTIPILLIKENFVIYLGVPLMAKGQVLGVLEMFHRSLLIRMQTCEIFWA